MKPPMLVIPDAVPCRSGGLAGRAKSKPIMDAGPQAPSTVHSTTSSHIGAVARAGPGGARPRPRRDARARAAPRADPRAGAPRDGRAPGRGAAAAPPPSAPPPAGPGPPRRAPGARAAPVRVGDRLAVSGV